MALRDGALVFDGPTSALTPPFLRELYGTDADALLGNTASEADGQIQSVQRLTDTAALV